MAKKNVAQQAKAATGRWHSSPGAIKRCTCQHEYQDQRFGKGMRYCNPAHGSGDTIVWVCTVCGTKH